LCNRAGSCRGVFLAIEAAETIFECQDACNNFAGCDWFTFDTSGRSCELWDGCNDIDDTCLSCVSSNVDCDLTASPEFNKILVVGGIDDDSTDRLEAFVVDLENERICNTLPNYPTDELSFATGAYVDGKPVVCGGQVDSDLCFAYDVNSDSWVDFPSLVTGRDWHRSSVLAGDVWVISGGDAGAVDIEFWNPGVQGFDIVDNIKRFYGHCQVRPICRR